MNQKALSLWLKIAVIVLAFIGICAYVVIIPSYAVSKLSEYPEFADRFLPWLLFITFTAIPVYFALTLCFQIAVNIGKDNSFSQKNARYLKWIMIDVVVACVYFFVGNVVLFFLSMSHPGIFLLSLLVVLLGFTLAVAAAVLSHLVAKAASIKDENDLTI